MATDMATAMVTEINDCPCWADRYISKCDEFY